MTDTTQLQTWLTEALNAYHALMTGTKVVRVSYGTSAGATGITEYRMADINNLKIYISDLQNQITAATTGQRRGPISVVF